MSRRSCGQESTWRLSIDSSSPFGVGCGRRPCCGNESRRSLVATARKSGEDPTVAQDAASSRRCLAGNRTRPTTRFFGNWKGFQGTGPIGELRARCAPRWSSGASEGETLKAACRPPWIQHGLRAAIDVRRPGTYRPRGDLRMGVPGSTDRGLRSAMTCRHDERPCR